MPFRSRGGHRSNPTPPGHFGGWKAVVLGIAVIVAAVLYALSD